MGKEQWTMELFQAIDNFDTDSFSSFLADDVTFRLGNLDPASGKGSVSEMVGGFFNNLNGINHEIIEMWEYPNAVICQGEVTYTRKDSSELHVPFANILKLEDDLIKEYQVYVDISQLF